MKDVLDKKQLKISTISKEKFNENIVELETLTWKELKEKLFNPIVHSNFTIEQYYNQMTDQQKNDLKNMGAFVGGVVELNNEKTKTLTRYRQKNTISSRSILTMDADYAGPDFVERVKQTGLNCIIYTTTSHFPEIGKYKYRIIIPLNEELIIDKKIEFDTQGKQIINVYDKYEPITRKIAELIGLEFFDKVSYSLPQLVFFPSILSNSVFEKYELNADTPFLDGESILSRYTNWQNRGEWPGSQKLGMLGQDQNKKDPRLQATIEGAFCREISLEKVMETLAPGFYIPSDNPERYTRVGSSGTKGMHLWGRSEGFGQNLFAYSFHGTDTLYNRAVNAFELFKELKFGDLDNNEDVSNMKYYETPSYKAALLAANSIPEVALNYISFNEKKQQEKILETNSFLENLQQPNQKDLEKEAFDRMKVEKEKENQKNVLNNILDLAKFALPEKKEEEIVEVISQPVVEVAETPVVEVAETPVVEVISQPVDTLEKQASLNSLLSFVKQDMKKNKEETTITPENVLMTPDTVIIEEVNVTPEIINKASEMVVTPLETEVLTTIKEENIVPITTIVNNANTNGSETLQKEYDINPLTSLSNKNKKNYANANDEFYWTLEEIDLDANFAEENEKNLTENHLTPSQRNLVRKILSIKKGEIIPGLELLGYPVKWQGKTSKSRGGYVPVVTRENIQAHAGDNFNYINERLEFSDFRKFPALLSDNWKSRLKKKGKTSEIDPKFSSNIALILTHDKNICAGIIGENLFSGSSFDVDPEMLVWREKSSMNENATNWTLEFDNVAFATYLEENYGGLSPTNSKITEVVPYVFNKNQYCPIKEKINSLPEWDGVPRVDTLIIDYLGAEDTKFSRFAAKALIFGMIGRIFYPGCEFQLVVGLISEEQGFGKTNFCKRLSLGYTDDKEINLSETQKAAESLVNKWIKEDGEGIMHLKNSEASVKSFIQQPFDEYRRPYDRKVSKRYRRNIIVTTSNIVRYLKDKTGNRRHIPIICRKANITKEVLVDMDKEWDQIFAEGKQRFSHEKEMIKFDKKSLAIIEPPEIKKELVEYVKQFTMGESNEFSVTDFIFQLVPPLYEKSYSKDERRLFVLGDKNQSLLPGAYRRPEEIGKKLVPKTKICAEQVWVEGFKNFGMMEARISKADIEKIVGTLSTFDGLTKNTKRARIKTYSRSSYVYDVSEELQEEILLQYEEDNKEEDDKNLKKGIENRVFEKKTGINAELFDSLTIDSSTDKQETKDPLELLGIEK